MRVELKDRTMAFGKQLLINYVTDHNVASLTGANPSNIESLVEELQGLIDVHELSLKYKVNANSLHRVIRYLEELNYLTVIEDGKPNILFVSESFFSSFEQFTQNLRMGKCITVEQMEKLTGDNNIDLIIALDIDGNRKFYNKVSQFAKKIHKEWLHVSITKEKIFLGPLFIADETPCYNCYSAHEIHYVTHYKNACYKEELEIVYAYLMQHLTLLKRVHKRYSLLANRELTLNLDMNSPSIVRVIKTSPCKECSE